MLKVIGKALLWVILLPFRFLWYCIKSLWHSFIREFVPHLLKVFGFGIAYAVPTIYILFKLIKERPANIGYYGLSLLIVIILGLIWFFGFKRKINEKLKEKKLLNRVEHGGNAVLIGILSFFDNIFKLVPFALLYLANQALEELTIKTSSFFLILLVLACVGRFLYWIDDIINIDKREITKENKDEIE